MLVVTCILIANRPLCQVLLGELYRNLALAGVSVLVVTCILIANLWTSILVFLCVIFTVVSFAFRVALGGVEGRRGSIFIEHILVS